MNTLLDHIDRLISEEGEYSGVTGKINKYSGDIMAGAMAHLAGRAAGASTHDPGTSALTGLGVYGAYKAHDLATNKHHTTGKSMSGSGIGASIGAGLAEAGLRGLKHLQDTSHNAINSITV